MENALELLFLTIQFLVLKQIFNYELVLTVLPPAKNLPTQRPPKPQSAFASTQKAGSVLEITKHTEKATPKNLQTLTKSPKKVPSKRNNDTSQKTPQKKPKATKNQPTLNGKNKVSTEKHIRIAPEQKVSRVPNAPPVLVLNNQFKEKLPYKLQKYHKSVLSLRKMTHAKLESSEKIIRSANERIKREENLNPSSKIPSAPQEDTT